MTPRCGGTEGKERKHLHRVFRLSERREISKRRFMTATERAREQTWGAKSRALTAPTEVLVTPSTVYAQQRIL